MKSKKSEVQEKTTYGFDDGFTVRGTSGTLDGYSVWTFLVSKLKTEEDFGAKSRLQRSKLARYKMTIR